MMRMREARCQRIVFRLSNLSTNRAEVRGIARIKPEMVRNRRRRGAGRVSLAARTPHSTSPTHRDLLEVGQVGRKECVAEALEVAVLRVVDLDDAPRVAARAHGLAVDLDLLLRADDRKGHEGLHGH